MLIMFTFSLYKSGKNTINKYKKFLLYTESGMVSETPKCEKIRSSTVSMASFEK
jgi:hypothetical protein